MAPFIQGKSVILGGEICPGEGELKNIIQGMN